MIINSQNPTKDQLLSAMKANNIPEGWSGLWYVKKLSTTEPRESTRNNRPVILPPGAYTYLYRLTTATMHQDPPGEIVMEDTPFELCTHLGFVMRARGRVLVTGLGMGCVIRGLLANPNIEFVTCIENSKDVIRLVQPHIPKSRLEIVQADALEWTALNKEHFDCAWHDLWTNQEAGEPHLDFWHVRLLMNCRQTVVRQGAWSFDRILKRKFRIKGFQWIG